MLLVLGYCEVNYRRGISDIFKLLKEFPKKCFQVQNLVEGMFSRGLFARY